MRVALVHDWLTGMRGGEKCLEVLCELFPDAPLYTLLHIKNSVSEVIESHEIRTSFVQKLPSVKSKYRSYLPLFPRAIESFDFSKFDLLLSSSHCVAKGVRVNKTGLHICYCHTPMRYVWDQYDEYFGKGRAGGAVRGLMATVAPYLRRWDTRTADRVSFFIANSENVKERIGRLYHRAADIIYPPVDTERFQLSLTNEGYYLIVSALVPYKRIDIAIEAFNTNRKRLIVVGKGPEEETLRRLAKPNIQFTGWVDDAELSKMYSGCTALVFPGVEDFGIVPLEAMACGKPVIAYKAGGALETVIDGITGIFFEEQTLQAILSAIESLQTVRFNPRSIREHALKFRRAVFKEKISEFISTKISGHFGANE
jgi:glycosyltransferase involved in cell wall biosynthesis